MTHIHTPSDPRVFVFGSNLAGIHGAGAAQYAYRDLGADWGRGIGLSSNRRTYALPTKDRLIQTLPLLTIAKYVADFIHFASFVQPQLRFFVSEVGCGLAGYTPEEMKPMFEFAPGNCDLPPGW